MRNNDNNAWILSRPGVEEIAEPAEDQVGRFRQRLKKDPS
jgi:hypothetical protein